MEDFHRLGEFTKSTIEQARQQALYYVKELNKILKSSKNSHETLTMSTRLLWYRATKIITIMPGDIRVACPVCIREIMAKTVLNHVRSHGNCSYCIGKELSGCRCDEFSNDSMPEDHSNSVIHQNSQYFQSGLHGNWSSYQNQLVQTSTNLNQVANAYFEPNTYGFQGIQYQQQQGTSDGRIWTHGQYSDGSAAPTNPNGDREETDDEDEEGDSEEGGADPNSHGTS